MELEFRDVLIIVAVVLILLLVIVAVAAKFLGWGFVGVALGLLILGAVAIGATCALPLAYGIVVLVYWLRPNPQAPSTSYSIDQGREAGQENNRRGTGP